MVKTWDKTYASAGGRPVYRPANAFPRSRHRLGRCEGAPKWRSVWVGLALAVRRRALVGASRVGAARCR